MAKKVAAALGIDGIANADQLSEKLGNISQERERNMSDSERNASRVTQLQDQLKAANKELGRYKSAYTDVKNERDSLRDDLDTLNAEVEVKDAAQSAGVTDFSYAMHLFRNHCIEEGENAEFGEDPKGFFESLKKGGKSLHIFNSETIAAGPKPATEAAEANTQAEGGQPPQSDLPPQPAPRPQEAGGAQPPAPGNGGEEEDVSKMDPGAFQKRTEEKYGFRPSR